MAAIGRPGIGAHGRAFDMRQLALRAAIDGDAPDGLLVVAVGPHEADHAAIGRKLDARDIHVGGQEFAGIARAVGHRQLLRGGAVLLARGHVGQPRGRIGDARTVGRYGDGADAFDLGDVFRGHRPGLRLCGKRSGGQQGGGSKRRAKGHVIVSSQRNDAPAIALRAHRAKCGCAPICRRRAGPRRAERVDAVHPRGAMRLRGRLKSADPSNLNRLASAEGVDRAALWLGPKSALRFRGETSHGRHQQQIRHRGDHRPDPRQPQGPDRREKRQRRARRHARDRPRGRRAQRARLRHLRPLYRPRCHDRHPRRPRTETPRMDHGARRCRGIHRARGEARG